MTRRKQAPPPPAAPPAPLDVTEALERLGEALGAAPGGDGQVYLYRLEPKARHVREDAYLAKFDALPSYDELREEFGGGTFRARLRVGGRWTEHNYKFSIEGRPRFVEDERDEAPASTRTEQLLEALLARFEARDTSADEDERDRRDFHRTMRQQMLAREFAQASRSGTELDPFTLLERIEDLVERRIEGQDGGGPAWLPLVDRALEAFGPSPARSAGEQNPGSPPRRAPAPAALPARRPAGQVGQLLEMLAGHVEAGTPPETVVEQARDILPPVVIRQLAARSPAVWLAFIRDHRAAFPVFAGETSEQYLEAVHAALGGNS